MTAGAAEIMPRAPTAGMRQQAAGGSGEGVPAAADRGVVSAQRALLDGAAPVVEATLLHPAVIAVVAV